MENTLKAELTNIMSLVSSEAYIKFKDYLAVKQYYLNHAALFKAIASPLSFQVEEKDSCNS
jgi:hypothetical protein